MKDYFRRLKEHPGVPVALLMTVMCFIAAASNKNVHNIEGVLILGGSGSLFLWMIVLISNRKH